MTLGDKVLIGKKKEAVYPPQGVRCQKCLEYGHWSYECKGKRKYLHRTSRTQHLKKRLKEIEDQSLAKKAANSTTAANEGKKEDSTSSDSDSTDGSESSSTSPSSSTDSSSTDDSDSETDT